jgi:transcriptional regulator with XRE-family HTH domain
MTEMTGIEAFYGAAIHLLRWRRDWTARQLAEKAGLSLATLLSYERSKTVPRPEVRHRIVRALRRLDPAIEALAWVRAAFAEKDIRYDEAQAGVELAGLYLQKGRTAEVKRLVLQMAPVFQAKGVPEEARKALLLFRRAVEMETVTIDLARRVAAYLRRAQDDPRLRFEEMV